MLLVQLLKRLFNRKCKYNFMGIFNFNLHFKDESYAYQIQKVGEF